MILRPSPNQHSTWLLIITDNHNFPGNNSISCGCLTFLHSSSSWSDQFRHNIPIFFGMNTSIYCSVDGRPFIGAFRSNQSGNRDSLRLQIPPLIQTKQTPFIPPPLPPPPPGKLKQQQQFTYSPFSITGNAALSPPPFPSCWCCSVLFPLFTTESARYKSAGGNGAYLIYTTLVRTSVCHSTKERRKIFSKKKRKKNPRRRLFFQH